MRRRDWRLRVGDAIAAAERIARFTHGVTFDQFRANEQLIAAVSYELMIIGEATNAVPVELQTHAPGLDWAGMRGMRNIVAHEYFGVDLKVVWDTATRDVPAIIEPLQTLYRDGTSGLTEDRAASRWGENRAKDPED